MSSQPFPNDEPNFNSQMFELESQYISCIDSLGGDADGRKIASDYMNSSSAIYKGEVIRIGYVPKLFDEQGLLWLDDIQRTAYRILEKVIDAYMADPDYRQIFGFSDELDHLVRLPSGYDCKIPIGRFDIFLNEQTGDFKYCEFNTDGSSAMNEDRESADALSHTPAFSNFSKSHRALPQELFDGWVDEFCSIYQSYDLKIDDPQMAIVDFNHSASHTEFDEFVRRFEARGMRTRIVWMDELEYHDGPDSGLYAKDGTKIDIVYRRAVTAEIMDALAGLTSPEETAGANALVRAFEQREVCLIGSFRTQIAHCKQIFRALWDEKTMAFLTAEEAEFVRKHIPRTSFLTPEEVDIDNVISAKDDWIIKPSDRYGSDSVYAGMDHPQEEWERLVHECIGTDHIVQEYCKQYPTPNCKPYPPGEPLEGWNNMIGYYNYGGRFGGVFNRAGQAGIIVGYAGGITVPTFLVDTDDERLAQLGLSMIRTRAPKTV